MLATGTNIKCISMWLGYSRVTVSNLIRRYDQNRNNIDAPRSERLKITPLNRPYLESAIFETCMISIFILVSFERK